MGASCIVCNGVKKQSSSNHQKLFLVAPSDPMAGGSSSAVPSSPSAISSASSPTVSGASSSWGLLLMLGEAAAPWADVCSPLLMKSWLGRLAFSNLTEPQKQKIFCFDNPSVTILGCAYLRHQLRGCRQWISTVFGGNCWGRCPSNDWKVGCSSGWQIRLHFCWAFYGLVEAPWWANWGWFFF